MLAAELLVAYRFHPVDIAAIDRLLDGDVGHGIGFGGAMPMFDARRNPDDITSLHLAFRAIPLLNPACAIRNNENLPGRVSVLGGASTRLEGDAPHCDPGLIFRPEQGSDGNGTGEGLRRPFRCRA